MKIFDFVDNFCKPDKNILKSTDKNLTPKLLQKSHHYKIDYCEIRINELVYQIYDLTKEEIKIVEGEKNDTIVPKGLVRGDVVYSINIKSLAILCFFVPVKNFYLQVVIITSKCPEFKLRVK